MGGRPFSARSPEDLTDLPPVKEKRKGGNKRQRSVDAPKEDEVETGAGDQGAPPVKKQRGRPKKQEEEKREQVEGRDATTEESGPAPVNVIQKADYYCPSS